MTPETTTFLIAREVCAHLEVTGDELKKLPIPRYKLPGNNLYLSGDVEAFVSGKPIRTPRLSSSKKTLSREELASWLRHNAGSVKRWGWTGHGPLFVRNKQRHTTYPLQQVINWLINDCRVA